MENNRLISLPFRAAQLLLDKPGFPLHLLADRMVELEYVERVSYETVRKVLKKTNSSRG